MDWTILILLIIFIPISLLVGMTVMTAYTYFCFKILDWLENKNDNRK